MRFVPGDSIIVPPQKELPKRASAQVGEAWIGTEPEIPVDFLGRLVGHATIISIHVGKHGTYAFVLGKFKRHGDLDPITEGTGWVKLNCCVRRNGECGNSFLHEVEHMKVVDEVKDWDSGDWLGAFIIGMVIIAVIGALTCAIVAIRAPGKVDSCYVTYHSTDLGEVGAYVIMGNIPWRHNVVLGTAPTALEANQMLKQVCPIQ